MDVGGTHPVSYFYFLTSSDLQGLQAPLGYTWCSHESRLIYFWWLNHFLWLCRPSDIQRQQTSFPSDILLLTQVSFYKYTHLQQENMREGRGAAVFPVYPCPAAAIGWPVTNHTVCGHHLSNTLSSVVTAGLLLRSHQGFPSLFFIDFIPNK